MTAPGATMTGYERVTGRLVEVTGVVGRNGSYRCPAHDDANPSLSVTNADGKVVLFCHAGCSVNAIVAALDLTIGDLFDESTARVGGPARIEVTYRYLDATGQLLYEVVRRNPKTFRQRRPDGRGGWEWNLHGVNRVPYRLPELIQAVNDKVTVFVAEGEKDADALVRAGEVATCNSGGAGKWSEAFAPYFADADVVIVADRDVPGYRHARDVLTSVAPIAATVQVVVARTGKDAADHLGAGHTTDELEVLSDAELDQLCGDPDNTGSVETEETDADVETPDPFGVSWIAEVAERVDSAPPVGWLARPVWPADAYGVISAEKKAGKTWAGLDLAVSVASGTPWFGRFECDTPGTVLVFLGEGGERKMLRRLRAVAGERGLRAEDLPVRVAFRVPQLSSTAHLALIAVELEANPAALVIIDPLYLAAAGAKSADLYAMGAVLTGLQVLCQARNAALAIVHHWNKTGEGHGSHRMTGAGTAEWGRVLMSVSVENRQTEPDRSTVVTLRVLFEGDEIPDTDLRIRRWVAADNPDELTSPLNYRVQVFDGPAEQAGPSGGLRPSERRILAVLGADNGWLDTRQIGDLLAVDDTGLKPLKSRTIQAGCKALVDACQAESAGIDGTNAHKWRAQPMRRAQPVFEEAENGF